MATTMPAPTPCLPATLSDFETLMLRIDRSVECRSREGMTLRQVAIMCRVYDSRNLTWGVKALAQALGVSKPVVTRALNMLEGRSLLKRVPREDDRRMLFLQRTEEGESWIANALGVSRGPPVP